MNRLTIAKQAELIGQLAEGVSVRAAARRTKILYTTALRNQVWLGEACQRLHNRIAINLTNCSRIEADELWAFILMKDKNIPPDVQQRLKGEIGSVWTWLALCPDTRFLISWHVGGHEPADAETFMNDVAGRIPGRVQLSTDQLQHYRPAVESAFGDRVDYATIRKLLKEERSKTPDGKFEQPGYRGERHASVFGNPDEENLSTGAVESMNLQIRQSVRRYSRSTNAFSRKLRNMRAALALHACYYNYCRIHPSIRVTPAMEMGVLDKVWEPEDLVHALDLTQLPKYARGERD